MAERAERLGAQLDVLSTPSRGTSVVLTLPAPRTGTVSVAASPQAA